MAFQIPTPMFTQRPNVQPYQAQQGGMMMPAPANPMAAQQQPQQQNPLMGQIQQMGVKALMNGIFPDQAGANPMGPQVQPNTQPQMPGPGANPMGPQAAAAMQQQSLWPDWLKGMFM